MRPNNIVLAAVGDSQLITVEAEDVPLDIRGVQVVVWYTKNLSIQNVSCAGLLEGGTSVPNVRLEGREVTDGLMGCVLLREEYNPPLKSSRGAVLTFFVVRTEAGNGVVVMKKTGKGSNTSFIGEDFQKIRPGITNSLFIFDDCVQEFECPAR